MDAVYDYFWGKSKTKFNTENKFKKVQCLTEDQKCKKDLALQKLYQQYPKVEGVIIPYQDHYQCSYRVTLSFESNQLTSNGKISVHKILNSLMMSTHQPTRKFYQTYVNGIKHKIQNDKYLTDNDILDLHDEREVTLYVRQEILEIIYYQKSFMERLKNRTKNFVKSIPSICYSFIKKLITIVLTLMGLNGNISSIIWKFIPSKSIISVLTMIAAIFFPMLAPIFTIGKFMF